VRSRHGATEVGGMARCRRQCAVPSWGRRVARARARASVRGGKISRPALCMTVYSKVNGVSTLWFPGDDEVIAKEVGAVMII
jgi:hypothetical protein